MISKFSLNDHIENEYIGTIPGKNHVYIRRLYTINTDEYNSKDFEYLIGDKKITILQNFYKGLSRLQNMYNTKECVQIVSEIAKSMDDNEIDSLEKFLAVKTEFISSTERLKQNSQSGYSFTPSNGEQHMIVLQFALSNNTKDVYILDEPESNVGHDYINMNILPRIKELARNNKIVIVSTHDANLGVRTLPYSSIYRKSINGISSVTYIGSPFLNEMVNIKDSNDKLIWSDTCLNVLEGGKDAFESRGMIYGKQNNRS